MVHRSPSVFRNLVTSTSLAAAVLAALSVGGARAPWSSFDGGIESVGGSTEAVVIEIGLLKTRFCFETGCQTIDTPTTDSCRDIGKTAASFIFMGLIASVLGVLVIFFGSVRRSFLSIAFIAAACLYGAAILTWSTGCHDKFKSSFISDQRVNPNVADVVNVTFEYGIGFGAAICAGIAAFSTTLFVCCTPTED